MGKNSLAAAPRREKFNWLFLPPLFVLLVVPLALRLYVVELDAASRRVFGGSGTETTLFTQAKAVPLWIAAGVMALLAAFFAKKLFEKRDRLTLACLAAAGAYWLLTLLSSIFSEYRSVAFFGVYNRAEGFFTITCYLAAFLYTMYAYRSNRDFRCITAALMLVVGVNAFLGVFEYFGHDLLSTDFMLSLVVPSRYQVNSVSFLFEAGKVHGTFYHYNFVGSFTGMVVPLFIVLFFQAEKLRDKLILGVSALLSLWLLFGSTSRAGLIGVAGAAVAGTVVFIRLIAKRWKPLVLSLAGFAVVLVGLNFATGGSIFERVPALVKDVFSVFQDTSDVDYRDLIPVRDIQNLDGGITFTTQTGVLRVESDPGRPFLDQNGATIGYHLRFTDESGVELESSYDPATGLYSLSDPAYASFQFGVGMRYESSAYYDVMALLLDGVQQFIFNVGKTGELHLSNAAGENIDLADPPAFGFRGKERLGSMRGYIWSRALPMVKDTLLLGNGPDTFALEFPQNDLLAKYYAYGIAMMTVDKPHNLYLQIALNEGVLALLAFLVIVGAYLGRAFRLYAFRREYGKEQAVGAAILLAVIGYLFAGFFNDSIVDVAPVFWILLGAGWAVNWRVRKAEAPATKPQ